MNRLRALGLLLLALALPAAAQSQSVASFTLINADTEQPIAGYNPIPTGVSLRSII